MDRIEKIKLLTRDFETMVEEEKDDDLRESYSDVYVYMAILLDDLIDRDIKPST